MIARELNITLKYKDGATLDLSGDAAQRVLQEFMDWRQGNIRNALQYTNAAGNTEFINFDCLCGLEVKPTTETTLPDVECEPVNCIADFEG